MLGIAVSYIVMNSVQFLVYIRHVVTLVFVGVHMYGYGKLRIFWAP